MLRGCPADHQWTEYWIWALISEMSENSLLSFNRGQDVVCLQAARCVRWICQEASQLLLCAHCCGETRAWVDIAHSRWIKPFSCSVYLQSLENHFAVMAVDTLRALEAAAQPGKCSSCHEGDVMYYRFSVLVRPLAVGRLFPHEFSLGLAVVKSASLSAAVCVYVSVRVWLWRISPRMCVIY